MSDRHVPEDIADRLQRERPFPRPAFRGGLRRRLVSMGAAGVGRPRRLRLLIAVYTGSGAALLLAAFIGLLGGGPLAPS